MKRPSAERCEGRKGNDRPSEKPSMILSGDCSYFRKGRMFNGKEATYASLSLSGMEQFHSSSSAIIVRATRANKPDPTLTFASRHKRTTLLVVLGANDTKPTKVLFGGVTE